MMAILTLLTSRSWLVLRLSTGWGGRGRDIVSRRAENSVLNTWTATLYFFYALICLTRIKLQIIELLFGTVPTWNPFCVWGVLVFASWEHLACSWLLLVVDCGSWLLADIFWHHLLSTGWFFYWLLVVFVVDNILFPVHQMVRWPGWWISCAKSHWGWPEPSGWLRGTLTDWAKHCQKTALLRDLVHSPLLHLVSSSHSGSIEQVVN